MPQSPPTLGHRVSSLRLATWVIWPWLNWLLPIGFALFCLWRFATARGEHAGLIVLVSPLLIPAAGLLGSLPRFILRRGGARTTPVPQMTLLMLLWWSWVAFALAMPDSTLELDPSESVPVQSALYRLVGGELGGVFTVWVFGTAIICGVGAWIALLVLASAPVAARQPRRRDRLGWAAFGLAPVLLVAGGAVGVAIGQVQVDAAGEQRAQAIARTADEQIALAEQRYDAVQRAVSGLRAAAAPHGWHSVEACAESLNDDGLGWDAYRLRITFRHPADFDLDHGALVKSLTDAGWTITGEREAPMAIEASGPQGAELRLATNGDSPFSITATSGSWWQSADQPVSASWCGADGGSERGAGGGGGAEAGWWPPLR